MSSSTSRTMSKVYLAAIRTAWVARRNALLSSSRFQQFAARFWLTRPIARKRARAVFDLVAGFVYTQTLAACVETGLLDLLARGPVETAVVADHCALPPEGAQRLLRAAAAIGLVERVGAAWMLGGIGAALRGNAGIVEMIAHHPMLYADPAEPVALLRRSGGGGALARYWSYAEQTDDAAADAVRGYSALMSQSQPLIAAQVLRSYRFARHSRLLDIGGGEGRFIEAVAAAVPKLDVALFDLPAVADRAGMRLAAAGLGARSTVHAGSFLSDPLPHGYDLITLVRVLHDHDDAPALVILRAVHAALPPGGSLLIAEPMAGTRGSEPAGDAYFGLYLLAMGSGRPRTPAEIHAMLRTVGFATVRTIATEMPMTCRVIVARRS